jgi:hypothetical protein
MKQAHHLINQRRTFFKFTLGTMLAAIAMFISSCHKGDNDCKKTVPLIATFQTTPKNVQVGTDVLPELDSVYGTGEGTPIGKSTFMALSAFAPPDFTQLTGNGGVITTENGDQILFATVPGPGPVIDFTTGNLVLKYRVLIKGGTGRFTGSTGGWKTVVHANIFAPPEIPGTDSLAGSITLDECHGLDSRFKK